MPHLKILFNITLQLTPRLSNVLQWADTKVVYIGYLHHCADTKVVYIGYLHHCADTNIVYVYIGYLHHSYYVPIHQSFLTLSILRMCYTE